MNVFIEINRRVRRIYLYLGEVSQGTIISKLPGVSAVYNSLGPSTTPELPDQEVEIKHSGAKLYIDPSDYVAQNIYKQGSYEPQVANKIIQQLEIDDVAIDIGAHIGHHTVTMRQAVGSSGSVFAFEPLPKNAELIRQTININGWENVHIEQKAVSSNTGDFEMIIPDQGNTGRAIAGRDLDEYESKIQVSSERLSDFLKESDIDHVDLMKIDIEGGEHDLLVDTQEILHRIDCILIEIHTTILTSDELETIFKILSESGQLVYHNGRPVTLETLESESEKQLVWMRE